MNPDLYQKSEIKLDFQKLYDTKVWVEKHRSNECLQFSPVKMMDEDASILCAIDSINLHSTVKKSEAC